MQFAGKISGLDIPGDATAPCNWMASWVAHLRDAPSVDLADFLTAAYIVFQSVLFRYWQDHRACRAYFVRRKLPDENREALLAAAWNWMLKGTIPGLEVMHYVPRSREHRWGPNSKLVAKLVAEAKQTARLNRWVDTFPIECVLVALLENPEYGENCALQDSGVDVELLRRASREPRSMNHGRLGEADSSA